MYKVYLGELLLPVAPSKIDLKYGNKNKTTTLIDTGEINIIKAPGLTEMSFEALLPNSPYPFAEYENKVFCDAGQYMEKLRNLKRDKKWFYFKVIRTLPNGRVLFYTEDFKATIEDLSFSEDVKEGFDVVAKIKLKQYVQYGTQIMEGIIIEDGRSVLVEAMKQREISDSKAVEIPAESNPKTYTVKSGDTLWAICKREYGDGNKYKEVAQLNGIGNPSIIQAGQVIKLA